MTTAVAEHPLVEAFRNSGIKIDDYVDDSDGRYGLIAFDDDHDVSDKAIRIARASGVKIQGIRQARYFDIGEPDRVIWELLFTTDYDDCGHVDAPSE